MQQIQNERAPLSFGEVVVVAVDFAIAALSAAALFFFVLGGLSLAGKYYLLTLLAGLTLAEAGTLLAAVCLLARKLSVAQRFQSLGALGGFFLVVSLVLFLRLPTNPPVLLLCLTYGVPTAALIGLAVYVRSITRRTGR